MSKDASGKLKKNIDDFKSDTLKKIDGMKKEASKDSDSTVVKKGKKSMIMMLLSFFESIVKGSSDLLVVFAELGFIGKSNLKKFRHKIMKSFILFNLVILGVLLTIWGLVKYVEHMFPLLEHGLGFVVVGILILFIAFIYSK